MNVAKRDEGACATTVTLRDIDVYTVSETLPTLARWAGDREFLDTCDFGPCWNRIGIQGIRGLRGVEVPGDPRFATESKATDMTSSRKAKRQQTALLQEKQQKALKQAKLRLGMWGTSGTGRRATSYLERRPIPSTNCQ